MKEAGQSIEVGIDLSLAFASDALSRESLSDVGPGLRQSLSFFPSAGPRRLPFTNKATAAPWPPGICSAPAGARCPGAAPDAQRQPAPSVPACEASEWDNTDISTRRRRGGAGGIPQSSCERPQAQHGPPPAGALRADVAACGRRTWEPGRHQLVASALHLVTPALGTLFGPP